VTAIDLLGLATMALASTAPAASDAARQVAAIDTAYQEAVKRNDADAMDRILHPRFQLVLGDGRTFTRDDLLRFARERTALYELQDEVAGTQRVQLWGNTAVVTALLWEKGTRGGKPFDLKLWFSDVYVREDGRWLYAFGQASLPIEQ
jgi:hypothetical protein